MVSTSRFFFFFSRTSPEFNPSCLESSTLPTELSLPVFYWQFSEQFFVCACVFGNINSVPTLFQIFTCAEQFGMGKRRRFCSKISIFCHYNRNRECHCIAIHRISSAYLQITVFEMSSRSVKQNRGQKCRCWQRYFITTMYMYVYINFHYELLDSI